MAANAGRTFHRQPFKTDLEALQPMQGDFPAKVEGRIDSDAIPEHLAGDIWGSVLDPNDFFQQRRAQWSQASWRV